MNARRVSAVIAFLVGLCIIALPEIALACPQCAGRSGSGYSKAFLIGGFMAFPFAVAYLVIRIIRKLPPANPSSAPQRGDLEG